MERISRKKALSTLSNYDLIVVGSGLFGLTVAVLAATKRYRVLVVERRNHPGGNIWSEWDGETGIEVHRYGPHIFHNSNARIQDFVNRFTELNSYRHHVWASTQSELYSLPVTLATMSQLWGRHLSPQEAMQVIQSETADYSDGNSFEEKALASIGPTLYERFFLGYTKKQWQTDPKELPGEVFSRLPIRFNFDTRYFSDRWEGVPVDGYNLWVERMLETQGVDLLLDTDFREIAQNIPNEIPIVYSGPIDELFCFEFGRLGWRTLSFNFERHEVTDFQGASQVNFTDESVPWTRIVEYQHFHPEIRRTNEKSTIISREFSREALEGDEPYYPMRRADDLSALRKYQVKADKTQNLILGGRLGSYKYMDMNATIGSAMKTFEKKLEPFLG